MAFPSRRLLPETLTSPTSSYSSSSTLPPSPPPPSPSQSPSLPNASTCSPPARHYFSPPPPPPPSPSSSSVPNPPPSDGSSPGLSSAGIVAVSLISSLFLLFVYFFILAWLRRRRRNIHAPHQPPLWPDGPDRWDEEVLNENQAIVHPIWLINTVGLQPEVIGAISVCVYRKGEGLIEGDYCSVCLSEFEEGEGLRLLPKCSHAFHLPCIDTWLRSHTNCPLCRAPILSPALTSGSVAVLEPVESSSGTGDDRRENSGGGDPVAHGTGESSNATGGVAGEEGLSDKNVAEDVSVGGGVLVGRRSVSMDANASAIANDDREGNPRSGRVGGARSLSCSGRLCLPGSDS